ncbi:MAG: MOSC domain-containing protein [Rhodothermales bacterium]
MNPIHGTLLAIHIAPRRAAPMEARQAIRVIPGQGLEGDRYALGKGGLSRWGGPHREVTLIAREDLDRMAEAGVMLPAIESRRNLLVEGVELEALLKREFWIGDVPFRGMQRCQPCKYLMRVTGRDDLLPAMVGRGGLRARVLTDGVVRVGDRIGEAPATSR